MFLSVSAANRLGFIIIGITTNLVGITMLSAAFDLLNHTHLNSDLVGSLKNSGPNSSSAAFVYEKPHPYCNKHSTSTILLANVLPSLATKLVYPFLLVSVPAGCKITATALLAAGAYTITGLFTSQYLIFAGVVCASLSFGLGESTILGITPLYGDESLSGWSIGTGLAAFFGSFAYALLRMIMSIKQIMMALLTIPVILLLAYSQIIEPLASSKPGSDLNNMQQEEEKITEQRVPGDSPQTSNFATKLRYLRSLSKYFFPLMLVYFAEYFINQGLFELIYYPEITQVDHAAQYRWFQVSYQLGVMISRSTLDFVQFKNIWAMSLLQFFNAILFLAHASKLIRLPNFYLAVVLIVYEGLLGGFTYVNAFYRVKKEVPPRWLEFSISAVTVADVLGIVLAGLAALPAHNALCQLYA